jgi:hypothetical protein
MSPENLSRRAILAGAASVPALALPAVVATAIPAVAAVPVVAVEPPAVPTGPTEIERLWEKRAALIRQYEERTKTSKALARERDRRMPAPHPSIVYSPENAADGLERVTRRCRDPFIWPIHIESALNRAKYGLDCVLTFDEVYAAAKAGGAPMTAERTALCDRLTARLDLSQRYLQNYRQNEKKIGFTANDKKIERLLTRKGNIEDRILWLEPVTRADIQKKLAIHDDYGDDPGWTVRPILGDLRRLFEEQTTLAPPVQS